MSENSNTKPIQRIVRCPQCGQDSVFASTNPYRPFCSERCKLIDLGEWASESFRIPAEKVDLDTEKSATDADSDDDLQ